MPLVIFLLVVLLIVALEAIRSLRAERDDLTERLGSRDKMLRDFASDRDRFKHQRNLAVLDLEAARKTAATLQRDLDEARRPILGISGIIRGIRPVKRKPRPKRNGRRR